MVNWELMLEKSRLFVKKTKMKSIFNVSDEVSESRKFFKALEKISLIFYSDNKFVA